MEENERKERYIACLIKRVICVLLFSMISVLFILCLSSCSQKVVTVPEYHTQYINRVDTFVQRDSIFNNSVTVIREANGADSVLLQKYGIKLKDNERVLLLLRNEMERLSHNQLKVHTDTFIKTDSIRVPYPVEKKLSRWEVFCIDYGKIMLGVTIASLIGIVLVIWLRKRSLRR